MTALRRIDSRWWLGLGLVLTAAKLWLSRGQGIYALGSAGHDDQLFIQLAEHLVRGEWLGPYNQLTLAKGAAYSLFIAACFAIGLPLFLAQHLLYAGACALFVRALRPAIASAGWRLAIYALLLCNPMTYDAPSMGRVLRQHIYGPLALLIFAGLVALWFRRQSRSRRQLPWAILTGLALGAFYLTREEALWIVPSMLLLTGAYLFGCWRDPSASLRRGFSQLAVLAFAATLPVFAISLQNYRHYGWFGTCEFRSAAFQDAYGALLRVEVGRQLPLVAMTREARVAIGEASPAFAEVQRQFDNGIARGWAEASEFFTHVPPAQEQIGGGWLMWALRDAVRESDPSRNAAQTLAFYQRLADEVNDAVDTGRLPGGPRRHGFMPRWSADLTGPFWSTALEFSDYVFSFRNFSGRPPPSSGSAESLQQFRDLTRDRLSPPEGELDVVGAKRYLLNLDKVSWLHTTGRTLRPVLLGLFIVAQALAVLRLFQAAWRREWTYPLTLATAAWGACAVSVLMHAMIQVSSFPVRTISSFAPIYPLLLVFIAAIFWDAALNLPALFRRKSIVDIAPTPHVPPLTTALPLDRWLPWLAGLVALTPFIFWHRHFAELFWFGDDLFLIDQMAAMGLRDWSTRVFSENFVPLFKLLWGGAVMLFDGSYGAMLWLMWLTHALNTAILGRLLTRAGFSRLAILTVLTLFALTPANIETLGWSVQWSAVLATTFLLLGLATWQRASATGLTWRTHLLLALLAAASACSFSRGVLTGPVLALAVMTSVLGSKNVRDWLTALPGAVFCGLPALLVALVISHSSSGNHQHMSGHWGAAIEFGLGYFLFNPAHVLLGEPSFHPIALVALAAAKIALLFAGLWLARGSVRTLLLLLLAYDLGNAVLLGIGRYHTGFFASMSSRYQYSALLATLPFFAVVLDALFLPLPVRRFHAALTAVVVAGLILFCLRGWPSALADFTGWRGTDMRRLMVAPPTNAPDAKVPTLDFMHIERAKALQRAYHLH